MPIRPSRTARCASAAWSRRARSRPRPTTKRKVTFAGIVPDLFTEGSGVVAEGRMMPDGTFQADNLLAKHDENYMPRELEDMSEDQARATVAETTE